MTVSIDKFGSPETRSVDRIRITTSTGSNIALIPVGARLVEAHFPDRNGQLADVVLGFGTVSDYLENDTYAGAIAGRYANRIAGGRAEIDGRITNLDLNEGRNHLHGGFDGLDRQHWQYAVDEPAGKVTFTFRSPDGSGGYPGTLDINVSYQLDEGDVLRIEMVASTTASTVINLVSHSYWNLAGHRSGSVLDQTLMINASTYVPVDDELLATGEILLVKDTAFDFRQAHPIGERIRDVPATGGAGRIDADAVGGYDHNWVLDGTRHQMHLAAVGIDPASGRRMTLFTTEPGVQMYTAGYMNGLPGKDGATYDPGAGYTLETQTFPCAPNIPYFPTAVLRPGRQYRHSMLFEFDARG